jgi:hypothetical protein
VTDDDQLARLLAELAAAEELRGSLPMGSRDRALVEQTIVVLELRIRAALDRRQGTRRRSADGSDA